MDMDDEVECQSDVEEVANSVQYSSSTKESEQEGPSVPWSELPPFAVERIYSFLSREDQSSMSQVCKNWSEEYNSPNLWREITFNIPKRVLTADMHPAVRSAQRYGRYFQHVRVVRRRRYLRAMPEVIQRQLNTFFQFLAEHSQLLSISFIHIRCITDEEDLRQSLINLLRTQNKLQSVEFHNTLFEKKPGVEILKIIFSRNSGTLKRLLLVDFMCKFCEAMDTDDTDNVTDLSLMFETLMNLKKMAINYSHYFENIITSICEYRNRLRLRERGILEKITLVCEEGGIQRIHYNGIQPEAWKYFREMFPALKMFVHIKIGTQSTNDVHAFLVRHMPVTRLFLKWEANHSALEPVLQHLTECEINRSLEVLNVQGLKNDNLAQDLLNFLQEFPKLEKLHLDIQSPVNDLNSIFEYWLENGPLSLKDVLFIIRNVRDRSLTSNYTNLANTYAPLLQEVGLLLRLIADND